MRSTILDILQRDNTFSGSNEFGGNLTLPTNIFRGGSSLGEFGVIVEESSNDDGSYVVFSNGLQICWHFFTIDKSGPVAGNSRLQSEWVLPAEYDGDVITLLTLPINTASNFYEFDRLDCRQWGGPIGSNSIFASFSIFTETDAVAHEDARVENCHVMAIGMAG